eukprot:TRINITY_DN3190_c0_g1_i3.p1 TRINITY_DN3190_c0_g1~~TRINITY_DN3190_c0_g1_i3.p1  ORF type:complete len:446 (+),score=146.58 TRINITY_DN3190_c0_g1_i3:77-1414(+)
MQNWAGIVGKCLTPTQRTDLIKKHANVLNRTSKSGPFDSKGYDKLVQVIYSIFHRFCIALESDWPDSYRINRYVRGDDDIKDSLDSLSEFKRFPRWMWRNEVMLDFVTWLREYNREVENEEKVGIYGMDLYSFFESAHEVISHLESVDPELAILARKRYNCFQSFKNTRQYTLSCAFKERNCESNVKNQLIDMVRRYENLNKKKGGEIADFEEEFHNKMNALVVKDAEEYYRKSFNEDTWNLRDTHMVDTLEQILKHSNQVLAMKGAEKIAKCVVWAHNSHIGDVSQTEMSKSREINVGQLVRKRFGREKSFSIGFTTHTGSVTASSDWDGPQKKIKLNPSLPDSYERILHDSGLENYYLIFKSNDLQVETSKELNNEFCKERLERYVGVIYKPDTELRSHYSDSKLSNQFDAVIHLDQTTALKPLDKSTAIVMDGEEETWPTGL